MRGELDARDVLVQQMNEIHIQGIEEMDNLRALSETLEPIKKIVKTYRKNYKPTSRDWTKANTLLLELEKLIE